ncbi:SDR family NAD(P)-dependent oxidoreductase [Azospirillum sp. TSA2s]|uniref:SDR family NAD(P)-dependent oxidoreductase n=1 Tax=Azospirillum sp. TSA2s TaxID=709810 RepID=UPI001FFF0E33|nr:SDR family NAD(P)-dependent oxidoreductase [Azospirillum sp. TSA2s]
MKTWLITGCSSGFGQRLALAAAQRGDQVIATARDVKAIEEMAEPFGGRMITSPLDVTDAAAAKAAAATAVETFGGFDVLVNNAGYGLFGAIEEGTPEEYRPMFEVNVFGLIETTRAALSVLRHSGGTIVSMSSGAGIAGSGGGGGGGGYYNAAKFAVEGISEALASELAPFGIRVLTVELGHFAPISLAVPSGW